MKTCFLTLFALLLHTWCVAQGEGVLDGGAGRVLAKAEALSDQGRDAYYDGDYRKAEALLRRSLARFRRAARHDTLPAYAETHWRLADTYRHLRQHERALAAYDSTEAAFCRLNVVDSLDLADIDFDRARVYSQMYLPERSMRTYARVRDAYVAAFGARTSEVANLDMNVGLDLVKMGRYRDAESQLLGALDIFQAVSDSTSEDFNRIYTNLGYLYSERGDYHRALTFGQRALAIKLLNYAPEHPSVSKYHFNIADALASLGRYDEAIPYAERALEIARISLGERHAGTAGYYGDLSDILADAGELARARRLLLRSNHLIATAYPVTHPYRISGQLSLGRLEEDLGNYPTALRTYTKALAIMATSPEPQRKDIAYARQRQGMVYRQLEMYDSSLVALEAGLGQLSPKLEDYLQARLSTRDQAQQSFDAIGSLQDEPTSLALLSELAATHLQWGLKEEQSGAYERALIHAEVASELVVQLRASYPSEAARQFLREETSLLYKTGIHAAQVLYQMTQQASYLQRALALSNAAKAALLRDQLREGQIRELAGLPDSLSQRLDALRATVRQARQQGGANAEVLARASFVFQEAKANAMRDYPRYAKLSGQSDTFEVLGVERSLPSQTVFVDYYLLDSLIAVVTVAQGAWHGVLVPYDSVVVEAISKTQALGVDRGVSRAAAGELLAVLAQLYQTLVRPLEAQLTEARAMLVCPDGALAGVPLEALVVAQHGEGFREAEYLLHRLAVSYVSAPAVFAQRGLGGQRAQALAYEALALAPTFSDTVEAGLPFPGQGPNRAALGPLRFAPRELAAVASAFRAETAEGSAASGAYFLAEAPHSRVLHLATHGVLDNRDPLGSGLYFTSSGERPFVSAGDIYGMELSATLAVLSACNTAAGELRAGEGVQSLARAFMYAGCESVVASRWLANDRSTAEIVGHFYAALQQGAPKDEALREAKLAYLQAADALTSHPYYWAGLELRGDTRAVETLTGWGWSSTHGWLFVPLFLVIGLVSWRLQRSVTA